MAASDATFDVSDRFALMIEGLRQLVTTKMSASPATWPLMLVISNALGRHGTRFATLLARFRAGLLRAPTSRAATAAAGARRVVALAPDAPSMPRGTAWLARMMDGFWLHRVGGVGYFSDQLSRLIAEPEIAALLSVSPQSGRLLRPLWRMLSADPMPASLRPARRVRAAHPVAELARTAPAPLAAGSEKIGAATPVAAQTGGAEGERRGLPSTPSAPGDARLRARRPRWQAYSAVSPA